MHFRPILPVALAMAAIGAVPDVLQAQGTSSDRRIETRTRPETRERSVVIERDGNRVTSYRSGTEDDRPVIGIATAGSADARDTLGLLVTSVTAGSPAEKAGIEEGNRLVAVNGTSLRLERGDIGDSEMGNALTRRLTRVIGQTKRGESIELRVYGNGQTRAVRVTPAPYDDVYRRTTTVASARRAMEDRAVLGISLGNTGSKRDTLGVLVMGVDEGGPAEKAGLEEGNRIAAINGTSLRVSREDAEDGVVASARARRLQRVINELKPGDDVELRVYANGGFRTVRLKAVAASALPRRRSAMFFRGDVYPSVAPMMRMAPTPPRPPLPPRPPTPPRPPRMWMDEMDGGPMSFRFDSRGLERIGPEVERALRGLGPELERSLREVGPEVERALRNARPDVERALRATRMNMVVRTNGIRM